MWKLSDETQGLVQQLNVLLSSDWWSPRPSREGQILPVLKLIQDQGEPAAVAWVAQCLFDSPERIATAAARTLRHLLSLVLPDQLIHLSGTLECSWGCCISDDWDKLKPNGVSELLVDVQSRAAVLGLLSFHRNGYVRQEAVRLLAHEKTGEELPYLLIRQNDWVGVIGEEAQAAVSKRLVSDHLPHFIRCLPLVVHLLAFRRRDLTPVVHKVVGMLVRPEHDAVLAEVIKTSSLPVRRAVVRFALEIPGEHRAKVLGYGLSSPDVIVRLTCAKWVGQSFSRQELQWTMATLQHDRFMPVRREGFLIDAEWNPDEARSIWQRALFDHHASIRDLARFSLRKLGVRELAQFYRRNTAEQGLSLPAVSGLAECGDQRDLDTFRSLLLHSQPSFRLVGVRGVGRIAKEQAIDVVLRSLRDTSPKVVREAERQLGAYLSDVPSEALFAIVEEVERKPVGQYAVGLIFSKGKWESLSWLIRIASLPDEGVASSARRLTEAWFSPPLCNEVFTKPTAAQRKAIDEAVEELRERLDNAFLQKLQGWLRVV